MLQRANHQIIKSSKWFRLLQPADQILSQLCSIWKTVTVRTKNVLHVNLILATAQEVKVDHRYSSMHNCTRTILVFHLLKIGFVRRLKPFGVYNSVKWQSPINHTPKNVTPNNMLTMCCCLAASVAFELWALFKTPNGFKRHPKPIFGKWNARIVCIDIGGHRCESRSIIKINGKDISYFC